MTRIFMALPVLPLLAGCMTIAPPEPSDTSAGECRSEQLHRFAGQPATQALGAEVIRVTGARTLQWVPMGTMVTMEFRGDRVRVWLDERNIVTRATCG